MIRRILSDRWNFLFILLGLAWVPSQAVTFPDSAVINVTAYGALGNDNLPDDAAIAAAINDHLGQDRILYFPDGTYLFTKTIEWKVDTTGQHAFHTQCKTDTTCYRSGLTFMGESRSGTILKLVDGATGFGNPGAPKSLIYTASPWENGFVKTIGDGVSAFKNYIRNLTVVIGDGNPGAVGIDLLANNLGGVFDVKIVSEDGQGVAGIACTRRYPGPALIKNVEVEGFNYGIKLELEMVGATLEYVSLFDSKIAGIVNVGNSLTARNLFFSSSVDSAMAVKNVLHDTKAGLVTLVNAELYKADCEPQNSCGIGIYNADEAGMFLRDVSTSGFACGLKNGATCISGNPILEWSSESPVSLFPFRGDKVSLNLPVSETPNFFEADTSKWMGVPDPTNPSDPEVDTENIKTALANAVTAGATTVWFRYGTYTINETIVIPASIRHIRGTGTQIEPSSDFCDLSTPRSMFEVASGTQDLTIEYFDVSEKDYSQQGLTMMDHSSSRNLVLKNLRMFHNVNAVAYNGHLGAGRVYVEDVASLNGAWRFRGQHVWARQFNVEGFSSAKVLNDGGTLWILGMKTEKASTIIHTKGGGKTELLGGMHSMNEADTQPAFINENSSVSMSYLVSGDSVNNYQQQIKEISGKMVGVITRTNLLRGAITAGSLVSLYVGHPYMQKAINSLLLDQVPE